MPTRPLDKALLRRVMDLLVGGSGADGSGPANRRVDVEGVLMHHSVGGVYRPPTVTYSKRYLDRDERY